ncbi:MAG: metallophosphoesterase [Actinomycetota bacterium]|nr:metallophosphoesterase [Actinomycetota bacterium]
MKALLISDKIVEHIYSNSISERLKDIDFVISCGDLPNYYLEFIVSTLNKPLFYVMGNHFNNGMYTENGLSQKHPEGCIDLDGKIIKFNNIVMTGFAGSMKYNSGAYQYSDLEMCLKACKLKIKLFLRKLFGQGCVDIIVTHAPPFKIHDGKDLCHRGFKVFNKLIDSCKPRYFIHGHIHLYGTDNNWKTSVGKTEVINAYGFRIIEIGSKTRRNGK